MTEILVSYNFIYLIVPIKIKLELTKYTDLHIGCEFIISTEEGEMTSSIKAGDFGFGVGQVDTTVLILIRSLYIANLYSEQNKSVLLNFESSGSKPCSKQKPTPVYIDIIKWI